MFSSLSTESIGIHVTSFAEKAELASLGQFKGIHVSLIELQQVGAENVRSILKKHNLILGGAFLPFGLADDEVAFNKELGRLSGFASLASALGCKRISTWISPCSDNLTYQENFDLHKRRVKIVAQTLSEYDCKLGLEFIGPLTSRQGHRFTFIHTLGEMLTLRNSAEEDNVGILLDSWHWYTSRDTLGDIEALKGKDIVDVHLNDAPVGLPVEQQLDNKRCLPGETGVIDCIGFLSALAKIGYDGPVMVEPFYDKLTTMRPRDAVHLVSESLKKVWIHK